MSFPIRPTNNMVMTKPIEKKDEVVGGIIIPGATANKDFQYGEIVAIGARVQKDIFAIGDQVIYPATAGAAQRVGKDQYHWVDEQHIWGIFTDEE